VRNKGGRAILSAEENKARVLRVFGLFDKGEDLEAVGG
jgi:hypothetical protein